MVATHAERREPQTPDGPLDLTREGDKLLEEAADISSGRAARTLTPGAHGALKQTLVALRAGVELGEHDTPGPSTIQVLRGSVTVNTRRESTELAGGQWTLLPTVRHDLQAVEDAVVLVTVSTGGD